MITVEIRIVLTAETPISVGAGGSAGAIADKVIVRDGWGRPLIPGSHVKGKVRHSAEAILGGLGRSGQQSFDDDASPANPIRAIFGSPRQRSPLHFHDLIAFTGEASILAETPTYELQHVGVVRPSVSLNRRRGTAEDARLLFQESAPEGLRFSSHPYAAIGGTLPDLEHAALLWLGLRTVQHWGSATSRGLGWAQIKATVSVDGQPVSDEELATAFRRLLSSTEGS